MFQLPDKFKLHDRVRRRITLAIFFCACAVPTLGVLGLCIWRALPMRVAAEARRLSGQLGLEVALEDVRHPRPGAIVYEGLQLSDPESGRAVFRCRRVEAVWGKPAGKQTTAESSLQLTLSDPQIEAAGLAPFVRLVRGGLSRRAGWSPLEIRVAAAAATLQTADGPCGLTALAGNLHPRADGALGEISFRLADVPSTDPLRIRIGRDRRQMPPQTGLELETGGGTLPCSLLALGIPGIQRLGPLSGYRGSLWINEGPEGLSYHLIGRFTGVDLERLAAGRLPRWMTGTAQLNLETARIVDGRLEQAAGSISAGPGLVDRGLLQAAVQRLGLEPGVEPRTAGQLVPYEQMAVSFQLDAEGLRLRGTCPMPGPGTVIVDDYARLLAEPLPQRQPIAAAALVQALVPAGGLAVPATQTSDWLLGVLPLAESPAEAPPLEQPPEHVSLGEPFQRR